MKKLTTKTDEDIIKQHLISGGEIPLSKSLQEKFERMDFCRDLIKKYGSRTRVAPQIMKMYGVSKAQAYRIFESTQDVFGTTQKTSREFWLDIILGYIMQDMQKASLKGDWRSVGVMQKNMIAAVEKLAGDKDSIPFEKVQPPPIMIGFFPETLKVELPDDWEEQVKKIIQPKRKIDREIHEAEILDNGED